VTTDDAAGAQAEWRRLTVKYPVGDASADPSVTMAPAKESVEFTTRYVTDYRTRRAQRDRLFTRILEEVTRNPDRVALAVPGSSRASHP